VITATGVVGFAHATSTGFGTGATGGTATSTGASTEFSSTTFLLDFGNATAIAITDGVDMAINVSGQNASGVAPTTTAAAKTALEARIQYNLTGTTAANVITGGALADTITGGSAADALNGGAGADTFAYLATTGALLLVEAGSAVGAGASTAPVTTTADSIVDFATTSDKIMLSVAFGTAAATGGLVQTGGTSYTTASTGLAAGDFIAIVVGGSMTAVTANTGGAGRFLYDATNKVLYYDQSGDTTMNSSGAWTAGAADDFVVATGLTNLAATDFIFGGP